MRRLAVIVFLIFAVACGGTDDEFIDAVVPHNQPGFIPGDTSSDDDNGPNTPANPDPNGGSDSDDDDSDDDNDVDENSAPTATTLVFPLNETECSNSNLVFEWNEATDADDDTLSYNLNIANSPDFDSGFQEFKGLSDTSYTLDIPPSTALYWRVESRDSQSGSYSETWSLYTQGEGTSNTAPQLEYISPSNNTSFENGFDIKIEWRGTDTETPNEQLVYKLYLSEVGQELEIRLDNITQTSFTLSDLNTNTSYQWAVYVTDADGATNVGQVYTFTIN